MIDLSSLKETAKRMATRHMTQGGRHTLLRPQNLRLSRLCDLPHLWFSNITEEDEQDQSLWLVWDNLTPQFVNPVETWAALWQLLKLGDASDERLVSFVEAWGMLRGTWEDENTTDEFSSDKDGFLPLDSIREFAQFIVRLTLLLVLTSEGQTVPIAFLEEIQHWDELPELPGLELSLKADMDELDSWIAKLGTTSFREARDEYLARQQAARWTALLAERAAGKGIEQQARMFTNKMDRVFSNQYMTFTWDKNGRRMGTDAFGIDDIVLSHIAELFQANELDVLLCSICGTAFPRDEGDRRPRYGAQRFCSDECRAEGKRRSNRLSWQRNSSRWKKNSRGRDVTSEGFSGQAKS
jgi:hypothetical protein